MHPPGLVRGRSCAGTWLNPSTSPVVCGGKRAEGWDPTAQQCMCLCRLPLLLPLTLFSCIRNVTLSAPEGLMPTLDFHFMRSVVHLCPTCHFHLHHIAIANERRGNGASIDFFVGEPGSVLTLQDSYRLRLACTSTSTSCWSWLYACAAWTGCCFSSRTACPSDQPCGGAIALPVC